MRPRTGVIYIPGVPVVRKSKRRPISVAKRLAATRRQLREAREIAAAQARLRTAHLLTIGVAHDIKNLLAAARLRVGVVQRDADARLVHGKNLDAVERFLVGGAELLGTLQALATKRPRRVQPIDLSAAIASAIEVADCGLRTMIDGGSMVSFACELESELPLVRGVPQEVPHVLINLLLNARDAMPRGGTVTVRARRAGRTVLVRVEDEGTGIAPAHLPRLFDAFFTTKGDAGTGMGLALAHQLMRRIQGEISARNRPEGGACFDLVFRAVPTKKARRQPSRISHDG